MSLPPDWNDLVRGESDRIEWKESVPKDALLHTVSALANDLGDSRRRGHLLVGIDGSGSIVGVEGDLDRLQQDIASRVRSSRIQPVPSVTVTAVNADGKALLVVAVDPYPVPPVVEVDGRAWVRIGTTTQRANHADLQRLNERRPLGRRPFDTRPLAGCTLDDVDLRRLEEQYRIDREVDGDVESFPAFPAWLEQKQFGIDQGVGFVPNAATLLVFGKSPQDVLPAATIDLVRYQGTDHDAPIVNRRLVSGALSDQLDVGWAWLSAQNVSRPQDAGGIRLGFVPEYPDEALKELLRNMVQHRIYEGTNAPGRVEWFDDRIEFSNPGGPYMRAAEGDFGAHSDYRNPLITSRLVAAGYVQQLGRGVRRARIQLERNGNPPLEVETDGFTRLIVRRRP